MPFDPSQDPLDPLVSQPRRAPAALMVAGVVGACTLGGVLGLWARPSHDDVKLVSQRSVGAPAPGALRPRQIEIRVDHPPAPVPPAPAEAAAPAAEPPQAGATAAPQTDLLAPKPEATGLVKVHAVAPERLVAPDEAEIRAARAAAERREKAEAQASAAAERKAEAARAAREAQAREARAEARAAEARKARKEAARLAEAAEAKARAQAERRMAEHRLAERKAAERRLAERKAAEQLAAKRAAEQRQARLEAARLEAARLEAARKAQKLAAQKAADQKRRALAAAAPPKADQALVAAERQLSRAYRQAEAAGVPSEVLERQQRRWLAARANAARKAPWAVRDIYLARIAELQDLTRQAARGEDF
jgi:colicin import membrane protein